MKALLPLLAVLCVSSCSSFSSAPASQDAGRDNIPALGNIELHTAELASELLSHLQVDRTSRIAVATFVPVTTLKTDLQQQSPLMLLGHQLEQGMITEISRRGWIAQDFKVSGEILMDKDSDRIFTRQINQLKGVQGADYLLSGTIVEQEGGAIVNARLIHAQSRDVIAAATKFFPAGLFWTEEQVTIRNGRLYRRDN